MSGYIPAQLQPLLGTDLDALREQDLERLIDTPESEWFDAKQDRCEGGEGAKRDLCADVAAFANRSGGLIVFGLAEEKGTVTGLRPLVDDARIEEDLRITQIVSSGVAPIPAFRCIRMAGTSGSYIVVSIPPSPRRPHCVAVQDGMRYPMREGAHKRYLAESEVADLYRSRFADARSRIDLADRRHSSDRSLLKTDARLIITMQPDHDGTFTLTRESIEPLRMFGVSRGVFPGGYCPIYTPSPDLGGVVLEDASEPEPSAAMLYTDGAGTVAYGWNWRPEDDNDPGVGPRVVRIGDEQLLGNVVVGLCGLVAWAVEKCGTSGDATLLAEIYNPQERMALWQYRDQQSKQVSESRVINATTGVAEMTVSLEALRNSATDLLLTARRVTGALENAFGVLGPAQVTSDGMLRRFHFERRYDADVERWAQANGILLTDA